MFYLSAAQTSKQISMYSHNDRRVISILFFLRRKFYTERIIQGHVPCVWIYKPVVSKNLPMHSNLIINTQTASPTEGVQLANCYCIQRIRLSSSHIHEQYCNLRIVVRWSETNGETRNYWPACSWEILTVGREEIFSFSAGGGPVFSNWPSNYTHKQNCKL